MNIEIPRDVCVRVCFRGRVQGVGFRWTASQIAQRFAVQGSVRNLADGTVELIAQGTRAVVSDYVSAVVAAMSGSIGAYESVEIDVQADLAGFRILR
ncbi:MAG: acylphosphatase [Planctomycetaceae bacterium]|nr:acylphosphatase [Planctomycetaceae bacterium]